MKETLRHQQAFEYYYMLGSERSYGKVASHFGVSTVSVSKWAKELDWEVKVKERDNKNMAVIREQNDIDVIKQLHSYRKVISASISDYIKRLKDGKVKIDSANDFAKLVRLDLELCGFIEESTKTEDKEDNTVEFVLYTNEDDGGDV